MDLDEYRRNSLATWDRSSPNWFDEREFLAESMGVVTNALVERLDPEPGQTILDIAAGTGETGYLAAERIGGEGNLISTDFSPGMVEKAEQAAAERGIANVEHRVMDAERMDLEDDSVDGVVSRFGYMLMADPAQALAETRRVLRDGGRLAFAVWATPDVNMWAAIPAMELVSRGHLPPPEPGTPWIFALGDTDLIRRLVTGAGFSDPEVEQVEVTWPYGDAGHHWDLTMKLAAPLAEAVDGLDEEERESVRLAVRSKIEELLEGGGATGRVHVVTAS